MTTKQEISAWFDEGIKDGAKHMLVICDTYDWDDYPVFTKTNDECLKKYHEPGSMQKVMEVYDLLKDKEKQLNAHRTFNLPMEQEIEKAPPKKGL